MNEKYITEQCLCCVQLDARIQFLAYVAVRRLWREVEISISRCHEANFLLEGSQLYKILIGAVFIFIAALTLSTGLDHVGPWHLRLASSGPCTYTSAASYD